MSHLGRPLDFKVEHKQLSMLPEENIYGKKRYPLNKNMHTVDIFGSSNLQPVVPFVEPIHRTSPITNSRPLEYTPNLIHKRFESPVMPRRLGISKQEIEIQPKRNKSAPRYQAYNQPKEYMQNQELIRQMEQREPDNYQQRLTMENENIQKLMQLRQQNEQARLRQVTFEHPEQRSYRVNQTEQIRSFEQEQPIQNVRRSEGNPTFAVHNSTYRENSPPPQRNASLSPFRSPSKTPGPMEYIGHPAFYQPKFTKNHPKLVNSNPITGVPNEYNTASPPMEGRFSKFGKLVMK